LAEALRKIGDSKIAGKYMQEAGQEKLETSLKNNPDADLSAIKDLLDKNRFREARAKLDEMYKDPLKKKSPAYLQASILVQTADPDKMKNTKELALLPVLLLVFYPLFLLSLES
jgi:hypothetical protein